MVITDPTVGWFFTISVNLFEPKEEAFATVKTGDIIVFNALQVGSGVKVRSKCFNTSKRFTSTTEKDKVVM